MQHKKALPFFDPPTWFVPNTKHRKGNAFWSVLFTTTRAIPHPPGHRGTHIDTHTYTHNEGDGALVWHNVWVNPDGGIICTHTHICELFGQRANTYTHWVLSNTYETISGCWKSKAICCLMFTRIPRWRKLHWPEGFPKIPHDADEDRRDGDGYQLHHLPISTLPLLLDACLAQAVGFQHHAPDILPLAGSQTSGSARPW